MAKAKKKKASRKKTARPMQVVSLKSALHMVRQAERKIKARAINKKRNPDLECGEANPARHFPKLKGRGRPEKAKSFKLTTRFVTGKTSKSVFKGTHSQALSKVFKTLSQAKPKVKEVILDDGKR